MNNKSDAKLYKFSLINFTIGVFIGLTLVALSILLQRPNISINGLSIPKMVSITGAYTILGISSILLFIKKNYKSADSSK